MGERKLLTTEHMFDMQEVHVACPCCKNKRLFDADLEAVEGIIKTKYENQLEP